MNMEAISSLYQRYWQYAQNPAVVVDSETGLILEMNPAAERLCGYNKAELLDTPVAMLHPEAQRNLVNDNFVNCQQDGCLLKNIQLIAKNGHPIPVEISSSGKFVAGDQTLVVGIYRDVSEQIDFEHQLASKNWALSAYSDAVAALGQCSSAKTLMDAICQAIVQEPNYVLAWIGLGEELPGCPVLVKTAAGSAMGYVEGIDVSWSAEHPNGQGPTAICIRSGKPVIMADAETLPEFSFWLERAHKFGIKSSASVPLQIDGKRGALMVYANRANAFSDEVVAVFQRLAQQIESGLHTIAQREQLALELERVQQGEAQIRKMLTATIGAMAATMESRDPYTSGHQERVAQVAVAIARAGLVGRPLTRAENGGDCARYWQNRGAD